MINSGIINETIINESKIAARDFAAISEQWISTQYRCYLTGALDSLPDLELPITSFQYRMSATPYSAYLSVIVPGVDSLIDEIAARPSGQLTIIRSYTYLDGSESDFEMISIPFETIVTNQGGRLGTTGTLSGHEEPTPVTPQTIELFDPITRASDNGGIRYRCRIDPRVRPNDTVIINGESLTVEGVILIVDVKTAIMEVKELAA